MKTLYQKYKQPIRGFLGWLFGAVMITMQAGGLDAMNSWTLKRWAFSFALAALPGKVGFMRGGDPNPTPQQMYAAVHSVKMERIEQGQEVTDPHGLPLKKP